MKRLLALLFLFATAASTCAIAGGPLNAVGTTPRKYATFPITYRTDQGTLGSFSNAVANAIASYAFQQWDNVATAMLTFSNAGPLPRDVTSASDPYISGGTQYTDKINPVVYDNNGSITDAKLGVGASSSVLGFAGSAYSGTTYIEGYVIINGALTGSGSSADQDRYRATLTHEVGHFLGLAHAQVAMHADFATMYPVVVKSAQQNLGPDDIASISNLYPIVGYPGTVGSISGTVKRSNNALLSGVNVIAMNAITGQAYSSVVDYFSGGKAGFDTPPSATGTYTIAGLPPGSYYVRIEPVNATFTGGSSIASYNTPVNTNITPEWYNGGSESGDALADNINQQSAVIVVAGTTTGGINFLQNESATISSLTYHDGTPAYAFALPQGSISRYAVRCTAPSNGSLVGIKLRVGNGSTLPLNGTLTISVHQNTSGSIAGIPGTLLGSVTIPFSNLAADQNNEFWLRDIGAGANFNSGDNFHIAVTTNGVGTLTLFSDDGNPTQNRTSYYTSAWRNFPDGGYQAGYNLILSAIYSSASLGSPAPAVSIAPTALDFGRTRPGIAVNKTFTLTNTGTGTLNVTGMALVGRDSIDYAIVSGGGAFSLAAGASRSVTVSFTPLRSGGLEDGSKSARLAIASNAATSPDNIPLVGQGVEPMASRVDTATLFGPQLVGGTYAVSAAVVHNTGTDTLHISGLALSGEDAGVGMRMLSQGGTMILPPDSTLNVRLQFMPTARRSYSSMLQFDHDGQNSPLQFMISGQGIAPVMELSATSLTIGRVRVGAGGEAQAFHVRNNGDAPLRVTGIQPSGLNASEFMVLSPQVSANAPAIILPGDSLAVAVQFRPTASGGRTASLDVMADGVTTARVELIGVGLQAICVFPAELVDFGDLLLGASDEREVRMTNVGNDTATVLGVDVRGASFVLVNGPAIGTRVAPDSSIVVRIRYTPGATGEQAGQLRITNDGLIEVAIAELLGHGVQSGLAINRNLIAFGLVPAGQMRLDTFVVRNSGTLPLTVSALQFSGADAGAFEIVSPAPPFTVGAGGSSTVLVRLRAQTSNGARSANLTVRTADGVEREMQLTATIGEALLASSTSVDFGTRPEQGSYDTTVVVRNVSSADIMIASITATAEKGGIPGSYFQMLTMPPLMIGANDSATVRVRFAPGAGSGSYRGQLSLISDGPSISVVRVDLLGASSRIPVAGVERSTIATGGLSVAILPPYPNPASTTAEIGYSVRGIGHLPMSLALVDGRGSVVTTIYEGELHGDGAERVETFRLSTAGLPSGRYFLLLRAGDASAVSEVVIVR